MLEMSRIMSTAWQPERDMRTLTVKLESTPQRYTANLHQCGGFPMIRGVVAFLFVLSLASLAGAQGQAINGTIEGTVTDESGGVLPGVLVTVANIDTGETRSVITNDGGVYRALLLPLGGYRVTAELQGFKKYDQTGISLSAGQGGRRGE
jgi:hypothetical protein